MFDRGTHGGAAFLVMAMLRGEALAARLERDVALAPAASVEIAGRVLSALAAAHAKGSLHRELKPENVVLVADEGDAGVRLIDFGVSKFRRAQGALDHSTLEGTLFGMPGYTAPEQCMGQRDIDHRASTSPPSSPPPCCSTSRCCPSLRSPGEGVPSGHNRLHRRHEMSVE